MKYLLLVPLALFGVVLALPAQTYYTPPTTYHSPTTYYSPRQCRICPAQSDYTHYQPRQGHHREIVRLIDVAQVNPAYASYFTPDGADYATQQAIKTQIGLLSQQLTALQQQLARPAVVPVMPPASAKAPAPAPAPTPSPAPTTITPPAGTPAPLPIDKNASNASIGLAVASAKCAACHQDGKLAPDQKFTLLDVKGNLVPLTDKQKLRVLLKTYSGQMPPPNNQRAIPPVTDAEFAAIAAMLQPGS